MNDVRRVNVRYGFDEGVTINVIPDENGTHYLVPVEEYEKLHDLIEASDKEIVDQRAEIERLRKRVADREYDLRLIRELLQWRGTGGLK
jgi:hypothetical protein